MKLSKKNKDLLNRKIAEATALIESIQKEEDRPKMTDSEVVHAMEFLLESPATDYVLNHLFKHDENLKKLSPKEAVLYYLNYIKDWAAY